MDPQTDIFQFNIPCIFLHANHFGSSQWQKNILLENKTSAGNYLLDSYSKHNYVGGKVKGSHLNFSTSFGHLRASFKYQYLQTVAKEIKDSTAYSEQTTRQPLWTPGTWPFYVLVHQSWTISLGSHILPSEMLAREISSHC